jgi:hypothetical protein
MEIINKNQVVELGTVSTMTLGPNGSLYEYRSSFNDILFH